MAKPLRNDAEEFRLLFEVSQALDGAEELSGHLEEALKLMARYTGMMRGTLTLIDPESGEIAAEAAYGLEEDERRRARYRLGEGITGRVIQSARPLAVPHVSEEPLFLNRTGSRDLQKEDLSFLCVPIIVDAEAVGALSADRLFADTISLEEDLRLLQVLAGLISRAISLRREIKAGRAALIAENQRLRMIAEGDLKSEAPAGESPDMKAAGPELSKAGRDPASGLKEALEALEKRLIVEALEAERGNMSRAAEALGITERMMGLRMKNYGLDYRRFRKKTA